MAEVQVRTMRKVAVRLIPVLLILSVIAYGRFERAPATVEEAEPVR
jgi:hypothetical protein